MVLNKVGVDEGRARGALRRLSVAVARTTRLANLESNLTMATLRRHRFNESYLPAH